MNISVFCSNTFLIGAKIMLSSFLENNNFEKHNIFIISSDLKKSNLNKLNRYLQKKFDQTVTLIMITEEMRSHFPVNERFSVAGFHKLYAFNYLPVDIDRIMCLDSDMIIRKSLEEFYYQDMGENILIAAEDKYIKSRNKKHLAELEIKEDEPYFNLGCIVIDLKKFRSAYSQEEYIQWIHENEKKLDFVAQDVINVLFKKRIKRVDYLIYNNQFFPYKGIDNDELDFVENETAVIHYIGWPKPWDFRYDIQSKIPLAKFTYRVMIKYGMKRRFIFMILKKQLCILKHKFIKK